MPKDESQSIVITAVSAVSAVGGNAKTTCASIKAGILPFQEHEYIRCIPDDPEWDEDLTPNVAKVPFIDPYTNDIERFNAMAIPTLTELFATSKLTRTSLVKTGLLLALPQIDPAIATIGIDSSWLPELKKKVGLGSIGLSKASNDGRTGAFALMKEAVEMLVSGQLEQCIVGGLDSYLFDHRIAHFDDQWRVKTSRNVDGFIPGEAAAMFMLETESHAQSRGIKPLARIDSLGFGVEDSSLTCNRASSGQGLSHAIREALDQSRNNSSSIEEAHGHLNGESYFAYEWGLVHTRLGLELPNISEIQHPTECVGETGAAIGALMVVNATSIIEKSKTNKAILLFTANDDNRRAALILTSI